VAAVRPRLRRLEDYLGERRDTLVSRSSASEYATALQHVRVMQRAITPGARTAAMADNLKFIVEHERPGTKFVVWAYDTHLAKDTARTVGRYAREAFGEQYYAVGTAFYRGAYQTRVMRPNQPAGDLQAVVAPPAPAKSLPWSLFRARVGNLFLDLRAAAADPVARAWVGSPLVTQGSSWATQNPLGRHRTIRFGEQFDGIIFIETTTPTRPTPNARKNVANRVRI
jgi:erythromycin esterase